MFTTKQARKIQFVTQRYLGPMLTDTRLSRFSLHHFSTSVAKVALKRARRILGEEQAKKMVASCSLKPVLPSSKSLSDSSTTSHSTLEAANTHCHARENLLISCVWWWTWSSLMKNLYALYFINVFSWRCNQTRELLQITYLLKLIAGGSWFNKYINLLGVDTNISGKQKDKKKKGKENPSANAVNYIRSPVNCTLL